MEEITAYKCSGCQKLFDSELEAAQCEFKHKQADLANAMLRSGCSLDSINYLCGFNWDLREDLKCVTKGNCFAFSHWQCSNEPAYTIVGINYGGRLNVRGKGGWAGYYGKEMLPNELPKPYPEEELFVYKG